MTVPAEPWCALVHRYWEAIDYYGMVMIYRSARQGAAPPYRLPRIFVSYVIGTWIAQWRQDVKIWQGKIYRQHPPGAADDGPLGRMRAWYGQFYPDGFVDRPCGERAREA